MNKEEFKSILSDWCLGELTDEDLYNKVITPPVTVEQDGVTIAEEPPFTIGKKGTKIYSVGSRWIEEWRDKEKIPVEEHNRRLQARIKELEGENEKLKTSVNKTESHWSIILEGKEDKLQQSEQRREELEKARSRSVNIDDFFTWLDSLTQDEFDDMSLTDKCEEFIKLNK